MLDKKFKVTWSVLKSLALKKRLGLHSVESDNLTEVFIVEDGKYTFWSTVYKVGDPNYDSDIRDDWEANYEFSSNGPTSPRSYDGRPLTQPVTLGSGQWHYWHGEGDDVTSDPKTVGGGTPFQVSLESGSETVTWSYRDPVWIAGGSLKYQGAQIGDNISFIIYAPPTPIVPSGGGNTGNCNLHESGILIPAAGDGAWDVDLTTAVPIPTSDFSPYTGFWDYALPEQMSGKGVLTPGNPGSSKYHLIPARIDLDKFVSKERLLGEGASFYEPQNINVSLCLPEWKFECIVENSLGSHTLDVIWRVLMSRYWTTL